MKRITTEEYTKAYINLLDERQLSAEKIIELFPDGTIFLCYEDPYDFCHRRVLAEWLEEQTGDVVPEWKNEVELKEEEQNKTVDNMVDF